MVIETHLAANYCINVKIYKSICHNRLQTHRYTTRHHGGVYMLKEDI